MRSLEIYCENTSQHVTIDPGTSLLQLLNDLNVQLSSGVLAALVDNQLKELSFELYKPHNIEFIDITKPDGLRTYQRSLTFLLQKAVHDILPACDLSVEHSVSRGLYCEITCLGVAISNEQLALVEQRMRKLVELDLPLIRTKIETKEAIKLFEENRQFEKALLQQTRGRFYTSVYYLDGYADHFYGPLVPSTGYLQVFGLNKYEHGVLLRMPRVDDPSRVESMPKQKKLYEIFQEHKDWNKIIGAYGIGSINKAIQKGETRQIIQVAEALHERKYAEIANEIYHHRERVKIVLISGPSCSGKTTTSKRVSLQMKVAGLRPVVLEMDNYFVNRENTPLDENGDYDFESIHAIDLDFFNQQLQQLLSGEEVSIPKFDFTTGQRFFNGDKLKVQPGDVLVVEGIHALTPLLTQSIPEENKFRIYASALTSISVDENNRVPTTDNRLLRRIVRDYNFRGYSAQESIHRWASVRRGEDRNIFPYQENADMMFNSALIYELSILRRYAEPLLRNIPPTDPAYCEATRLLKFLSYFEMPSPDEENTIPPTSVIREFIGGSSFAY